VCGCKNNGVVTKSEGMDFNKVLYFILYGIAMAMGMVIIVLPIMGQPVDMIMPGIAIFCLALAGLNKSDE
jgi:hypothetical protein